MYRIANPEAANEDFAVASEDEGELQKPHIVTYRNNLNKICNSLYNTRDNDLWEMDAIFLDGTTFLDMRKNPMGDTIPVKLAHYGKRCERVLTHTVESQEKEATEICTVQMIKVREK